MASNVADMCRLCGTDTLSIVRHQIFEAEGLARSLAKKIAECLPVHVIEQDRLPKIMCGECAYKLDLLSEFRDKAVKTEHLLESLVDGVKPEILDNEPDDFNADDGFRSDSPEQPEPEVLIKEEEEEQSRPRRRRPVRKAARKASRRGRKRKQTDSDSEDDFREEEEEEEEVEEAPKKAAKKDETPTPATKVPRKRGRKPKDNKESPGAAVKAEDAAGPSTMPPPPPARSQRRSAKFAMRSIAKVAKMEEKVEKEIQQFASPQEVARLIRVANLDVVAPEFQHECCRFCKLYVGDTEAKEAHVREQHPEKVTCTVCNEVQRNQLTLKSHLQAHKDEQEMKRVKQIKVLNKDGKLVRRHHCKLCDQVVANLKRHVVVAHTKEYPFGCDDCERRFPTSSELRSHVRTKHTHQFPSLCVECGKGFNCRTALEDHERKHRGERPFVCDICGKSYFSKHNLQVHIKAHQQNPMEFQCDVCGKHYPSQQQVRHHRMMHFEENRRFQCKVCESRFFKKSTLDYHVMRVHTLERPFECDECGKAFIMRSMLVEHTRRHLGVKFPCQHCSCTYFKKYNLRRHMMTAHKGHMVTWMCDLCGKEYFSERSLIDHKMKEHPDQFQPILDAHVEDAVALEVIAAELENADTQETVKVYLQL